MKNKPLTTVELFLLGPPRLIKDGTDQAKALKYRKAWALLGYLTAHMDQWQSREKIADLLWPDLDLPAARTNLRQVLSNLSGLLADGDGHSPLERNDRAVRWVSGSGVWLDLQFLSNESLARAGSSDVAARQWCAQVLRPQLQALGGLFLDGVQIPAAVEYEQWQQSFREFYRSRSLLLLEQTCHSQQAEGRVDDAIATTRQLLEMEPWDEGYVSRLMALLAGQGLGAEAVAVFERARQVMREQLGAVPGESLLASYDALLQAERKPDKPNTGAVAELRWIAAMYCDFQNQTALDEREDDAQRARFADTVARFGGKVFPTAGAGTFAVFGLAGVGERVALRALLSAQDLMAWGMPLRLRIGICCGKVLFRPTVSGGTTISGEVSDLAMRICLTAEPGQVLLSAQASTQIGRAAAFAEAGEWSFRGLEGRHMLWRWIEGGATQVGDTARGQGEGSGASLPFSGRAEELQVLMDKWHQSAAQSAQVVVVRAPAGYGKTRLLQEFSRAIEATGAACVQVIFRLEMQHKPMAPFFTALDQEITTPPTDLGSKSEAFARIDQAMDRMTSEGPTLILLDDVHWSDLASQEFLPLFVKELQARKVLVVIATRPGLDMAFMRSAEVLELKPLAETQARALVMAHQPADFSQKQCDWIVATAGGVPLYLELLAKGRLNPQQNLLSIRDVLQSELDQLHDGKTVLRAAAVIGMRFSAAMLGILMGTSDVRAVLLRAQSLQLIKAEAGDSYRFHHALIHDAVYESVPLGQRKGMHRQWAAHLQARPESPLDEVAQHWEAAQDWQEAAVWWRKAGDAALQREFAADAAVSFRRAIELLSKVEEAVRPAQACREAQLRLGYALHMAEGFGSPAAWRLFKDVAQCMEVRDLADPQNQDLLFAALSGCYMGGSSQGELDGLLIAERLSDMAKTEMQQLMAAFALGNSLFWRGEFAEASQWLKRGIALSGGLAATDRVRYCIDDPAVICRAFLAWSLWFQGHDAQASEMALETRKWANLGKRSHAQCFGFTLLLGVYWCQGKMQEVGALAMQTHLLAKQFGFPLWESVSGLFLLCVQAYSGAMPDTTQLFAATRQMQTAYQAGITTSRWIAADALVALGEWAQALALLEVSIAEADFHEDQYCGADLLWLRAKCEAATGHAAHSALSISQARAVAQRLGAQGLLARYDSTC